MTAQTFDQLRGICKAMTFNELRKAGDFDESKHPRDEDGKFSEGGGHGKERAGQSKLASSWDNPDSEQLARAQKVFSSLTDGPVAQLIDKQMRGGVLADGKFKVFSEYSKQDNLAKIKHSVEVLRNKDPEAFEAARQWDLAEQFDVKSYSDLPDILTVYRGHKPDEKNWKVLNVTSKKSVAENFGSVGAVTTYQVHKDDIGFSLHGTVFDEGELLIFDTKKLKKIETKLSTYAQSKKILTSLKSGGLVTLASGGTGKFLKAGVGLTAIVELPDGRINYAAQLKLG